MGYYSLVTLFFDLFAIAGGGGSSSGGGGGGSSSSSYSSGGSGSSSGSDNPVVGVIILVLMALFFAWAWYSGSKAVKKKRADMAQKLKAASQGDKLWDEAGLQRHTADMFVKYQQDWSKFDTRSMQSYMTPEYFQHASLMMEALHQADRTNIVSDIKINRAEVATIKNPDGIADDSFTATVDVDLLDTLLTTSTGAQLYQKKYQSYVETYRFLRHDDKWLLDGIDTSTALENMLQTQIKSFAKQNNLFFSLDWGYLLLPARGQLFSEGAFGVSDINNHCIGKYNDILVQLYTYIPTPGQDRAKGYVIAQAALPKSYGEIVVRHKSKLSMFSSIKNLEKIETEWSDFNKKYEIFASDKELATSLELLNPKYMEQLEAVDFDVSMQVVDNIVYLYASDADASTNYSVMLDLLKEAFKEMKM